MSSIGIDVSALDPAFKSHAQRGIGRYVSELHRYLDAHSSELPFGMGFFNHDSLRQNGVADKLVSLLPCGRTTVTQHLIYPSRVHQGAMRDLSLIHYPAHMDAPAWTSKPYVLTVHDLIPHVLKDLYRAQKSGLRFKVARALEVRSIRQATLLLSNSETTANDLVRVLGIPRERIVVTPLGVDERFFRAAEGRSRAALDKGQGVRTRLGIPLDRPIVLYVGGHDERKNIGNLIGIVREARDHFQSLGKVAPILVMAGRLFSSHERERLEQSLRRHEMVRDTTCLGYVGEEDLVDLYSASSLFLFPSLYEGFGLPALEAMAAGLPVVGANTSAVPEVVGDAGELFDPLSISAGARAVISVLDSDERQVDLSQRGITRARGFTWERTGQATVEGYLRAFELIGVRSPGRDTALAPLSREVQGSGV